MMKFIKKNDANLYQKKRIFGIFMKTNDEFLWFC